LFSSRRLSLDHAQAQLDTLYAKQGRISRFQTRADRDAYLKKEIADIVSFEKHQAQTTSDLRREHRGTVEKTEELAHKAIELQNSLDDRKNKLQSLADEMSKLKKRQNERSEQRKFVDPYLCQLESLG
jgi:structural maintenance of chromosome 3 (chondroitin sulfate proteoglycan 6)